MRGITLVETLASVALMAMVTVASAEVLSTVAALSRASAKKMQWEAAACRTLDAIGCDLSACDLNPGASASRVVWRDGVLLVQTRVVSGAGMASARRWSLTDRGDLLVESVSSASASTSPRVALTEVAEWLCLISTDESRLTVIIRGPAGLTVERRFRTR